MSGVRLFGNGILPACKYCEHTIQKFDNGNILCEKRGVVLSSHKCRHFIYDPLKRIPAQPKPLERIGDTEFEL